MSVDHLEREPVARRPAQAGQILVLFVIFVVVLIGAAALTIDYGSWLLVRRDYQNAADGAALAGAGFLTRPLTDPCRTTPSPITKPACARQAAWDFLNDRLGLPAGGDPSIQTPQVVGPFTITVASPASAAGAAYPGSATGAATLFVSVKRDNPSYLSHVFGVDKETISAWATAGSRSGRFAVIALRRIGDAGPGDTKDFDIAGSGTSLTVKNGDVGGNWGLAISGSGASLHFLSTTGDAYQALLADPRQSAPTCCSWIPSQVIGGTVEYNAEVPDPNYPLPTGVQLQPASATALVPAGDLGGSVTAKSSGPAGGRAPGGAATDGTGKLVCSPDSPKIGPGYYTQITVEAGKCLILDPTSRHTSVRSDTPDSASVVPSSQAPGLFYVNGSVSLANGAMLVGDGVTLVIRPGSGTKLDLNNNSLAALNVGATPGGTAKALGAWYWNVNSQTGASPYSWSGASWTYGTTLESDTSNRGIAVYVPKRAQYLTGIADDDNTNVLNNINAGAGMVWQGVIYAPHDNVTYSGQVGYDAVGQLVGWTIKFTGTTSVTQVYTGPEEGLPYLIEPRLGQ